MVREPHSGASHAGEVNCSPGGGGTASKSGFKESCTIAKMRTKMKASTLQGKAALVTGASRGIGKAVALTLAWAGLR